MRTPNAQQIEQITAQLAKYGKIEGKNVFYWFQNHKARERQKQKRNGLGLSHTPRTPLSPFTTATSLFFSSTKVFLLMYTFLVIIINKSNFDVLKFDTHFLISITIKINSIFINLLHVFNVFFYNHESHE